MTVILGTNLLRQACQLMCEQLILIVSMIEIFQGAVGKQQSLKMSPDGRLSLCVRSSAKERND